MASSSSIIEKRIEKSAEGIGFDLTQLEIDYLFENKKIHVVPHHKDDRLGDRWDKLSNFWRNHLFTSPRFLGWIDEWDEAFRSLPRRTE